MRLLAGDMRVANRQRALGKKNVFFSLAWSDPCLTDTVSVSVHWRGLGKGSSAGGFLPLGASAQRLPDYPSGPGCLGSLSLKFKDGDVFEI